MDPDLLTAFKATDYFVYGENAVIRIDGHSEGLHALLQRENAGSFAFITAYNPESQRLSPKVNSHRHRKMVDLVQSENWPAMEGEGRSRNGKWPPEKSLFILNIPLEKAHWLARKFNQLAFVYGTRGGNPRLVWTELENRHSSRSFAGDG